MPIVKPAFSGGTSGEVKSFFTAIVSPCSVNMPKRELPGRAAALRSGAGKRAAGKNGRQGYPPRARPHREL